MADAAQTLDGGLRHGAVKWWLALAGVCCALLIPLFTTDLPPLLDYPNHLARMWIIAYGAGDPVVSRMYTVKWGIQPNIGLDMIVPLLTRAVPLELAGSVFVGLAILLPVTGCIALNAALFRRLSYWPLVAASVAYNTMLLAGFVNYLVGVGLALWAAALWEWQKDGAPVPRVLAASVCAVAIFFCHIIAVGLFGLLLFTLELTRPGSIGARLRRLCWVPVPFAVPALLFFSAPISTAVPTVGGGPLDVVKHLYWAMASTPLKMKLLGAIGPFLTYDWRLDALVVVFIAATFVVLPFRLQLSPGAIGTAAILAVLYPMIPIVLMGASWIDQRIPIFIVLLLVAGTSPRPTARRPVLLWGMAFAALFLVRIADIAAVWYGHNADLADFRHVISSVPAGGRVLVVRPDTAAEGRLAVGEPASRHFMVDVPTTRHLPALLVYERKAFMPYLFSDPRKQPLRVLPPYDRLAYYDGAPSPVSALQSPTATDIKQAPYLVGWQHNYDWVLLLLPARVPDADHLLPGVLELAARRDIAAVYRVR